MKKMKIAVYSGEIPAPSFIERMVRGVAEIGKQEVLLFGYKKGPSRKYAADITVVGYKGKVSKIFSLVKYSLLLSFFKNNEKRKLDTFLKTQSGRITVLKMKTYPVLWHKPDIFHLQWAKSLSSWMWVKDFGIKLVVSLRGAHINYTPLVEPEVAEMYRLHFPKVDAFHAVSQTIGAEAQKYGAVPEKTIVIYSLLPSRFLTYFNRLVNPCRKPLRIVSIGRFHWKKGYRDGLEAIHRLKHSGIIAEYTIVAGLDVPEEILFTVHQLGLGDQVKFVANIEQELVPEEMKTHSLMLLPSLEEGIANVVLEAMAVGLPVISTNAGGMGEVIVTDETGWLVPVADPEAIANAILAYLRTSEEELMKIRQNAHAWIVANHNEVNQIDKFMEMYNGILDS